MQTQLRRRLSAPDFVSIFAEGRVGDVNREDNEWWNIINSHIASTGAALAKAGRLLNRPELSRIAQRQLDFISGRTWRNVPVR